MKQLSVRADPTGPVVRLEGELDCATAPGAEAALLAHLRDRGSLVVDLRHVSFIDCAGLGSLIAVRRWADAHDRRAVLARPGAPVLRLLRALELLDRDSPLDLRTTLLDLRATLEEAAQAVAAPPGREIGRGGSGCGRSGNDERHGRRPAVGGRERDRRSAASGCPVVADPAEHR